MTPASLVRHHVGLASAIFVAGSASFPAHADVLEIAASGNARWVAGPRQAQPDDERLSEIPADAVLVPDNAVNQEPGRTGSIPAVYAAKVGELSANYDLSPALIEAVVWQESRWRAGAVSPVGARGLSQLMPETARSLGVDPDDPMANLEGGVRYLRAQIDRFGGDIEKGLAAYNAGPGRVQRAGGVPPIRETQMYVASVMVRLSDNDRR